MTGARITISYDDHEVRAGMLRLQQAMGNLHPVLEDIGAGLLRSTDDRWGKQVAPDGTAWTPLASSTVAEKAARNKSPKILMRSGDMRGTIIRVVEGNTLMIGTNKEYAAIHQFGGTTKAHKIVAKRKKALFWPGAAHPVRSVNHPGSKIPARPFLGISAEDREMILRKIQVWLEAAPRG